MSYIIQHTRLGFCWWDLAALAVLIAVVVVFAVKHHRMKTEEKELEDRLAAVSADEAVSKEENSEI